MITQCITQGNEDREVLDLRVPHHRTSIGRKPRTSEDILDVANYLRIMLKDYQHLNGLEASRELGKRLTGLEWNIEDLISMEKIDF